MFSQAEPWADDAKCVGMGAAGDIFFPERGHDHKGTTEQAKAICYGRDGKAPCPVMDQCLDYAMRMDEPYGIWGGRTRRERNAIKRGKRRKV